MKKLAVQMVAMGSVFMSAQSVLAAAAADSLECTGKGITANISYAVAITDNAQVSLTVKKNNQVILDVATEGDEGKSADFIHNAYSTASDVDKDGNILHYGSGVAPTKLMAFVANDNSGQRLLAIDLENGTFSLGNKTVSLSCKSKN